MTVPNGAIDVIWFIVAIDVTGVFVAIVVAVLYAFCVII
jgi:hypothetical protein